MTYERGHGDGEGVEVVVGHVQEEVEGDAMELRGRGPGRGVWRGDASWYDAPKTLPTLTMHISIYYMYHGRYALVCPMHIG